MSVFSNRIHRPRCQEKARKQERQEVEVKEVGLGAGGVEVKKVVEFGREGGVAPCLACTDTVEILLFKVR